VVALSGRWGRVFTTETQTAQSAPRRAARPRTAEGAIMGAHAPTENAHHLNRRELPASVVYGVMDRPVRVRFAPKSVVQKDRPRSRNRTFSE